MIFLGFFIFLFSFGLLGTKDVNMILEKYSEEGLELFDKAEDILHKETIRFFYENDVLVIKDCQFSFNYVYDKFAQLRFQENNEFPYILEISIPKPLNENMFRNERGELFARKIEIRISPLIQNPLINKITVEEAFLILFTMTLYVIFFS